jgi:hypothetical protein
MRKLVYGVILGFVPFVPIAGSAQTVVFDAVEVSEGCSQDAQSCQVAIQTALAAIGSAGGLTPLEAASQIGSLAAIAVDAAQAAPMLEQSGIANAIETIASATHDPAQANAIIEGAELVASGSAGTISVTEPVAASPG